MKKLKKNLLLATVLTGLVACSSKPVVQDFPATANPSEEITNLESDMKVARENQVDVLSPNNFGEAQESLDDAKEAYQKGKDSDKVLREIALGKAYLTSANSVAEVGRANIEDVIAARQAALDANAPAHFGKEFEKADRDFVDLSKDIEKNKFNNIAKDRTELQAKYLDLELKAIKEKHLRESKDTIAVAKKEKAEKFAPRSFAVAEKSVADTDAFITANRHDTTEIEARAAETKKAAASLLNINRTARDTKNVSSEETAILMDQERVKTASAQNQLGSVEDELQTTQSALDREKDVNVAIMESSRETLSAHEEKIAAQKALDEKYESARKAFTEEEAEVYKRGDALLIRLKGMEFPSAQATIQSKNYPLLGKVQQVVEKFGPESAITIEGHTDSVGGKAINDKLSEKRATAVKEYLAANGGGITEDTKVEAVGYGYQKPLATNKTAAGRAQNRRVDIIIKPENTKL